MGEVQKVLKFFTNPFAVPFLVIILILFLILFIGASSSDSSIIINSFFDLPFPNGTSYKITSYFGERINPLDPNIIHFHNAIDVTASDGTEILASGDGYVISAVVTELGGEIVTIEHDFGGIKYRTLYAHMLENSVVVTEGQYIKKNDKIGIVGMSGTQVTGVHLHFELHEYDNKTNQFVPIDSINIFK